LVGRFPATASPLAPVRASGCPNQDSSQHLPPHPRHRLLAQSRSPRHDADSGPMIRVLQVAPTHLQGKLAGRFQV
jgi:hypothetical protein